MSAFPPLVALLGPHGTTAFPILAEVKRTSSQRKCGRSRFMSTRRTGARAVLACARAWKTLLKRLPCAHLAEGQDARRCRTSPGYDFLSSSLSASGLDGSPPCGRRECPGGRCCRSHKKDSCSQHSQKKDSRSQHSQTKDSRSQHSQTKDNHSQHSRMMDSYCRNTTHSRSQSRKTVRTVRYTPDSRSRRSTRQRRNQQHLQQRLRRLCCEPHGDRTVAGRPQRSRVSAVDLLVHQRCQGIASQSVRRCSQ